MTRGPSVIVQDNINDGVSFAEKFGYPIAIKPSFTLRREGHQIVDNPEDLKTRLQKALDESPVQEALLSKF